MEKSNLSLWIALIVVAIIAVFALLRPQVVAPGPLGGVTNYDELTLQDTGTTTLKILGNFAGTTGGCIETNATSTATKLNLRFSPLGATTTFAGTVYFAFGSCE